ncbi:MAG: superoxide dismutase [Rickettsiales bacterium]|jgi:Fe-Mn family superoxide dismutase|nr:superoxide dismutase [Rickettsiales bacterium]
MFRLEDFPLNYPRNALTPYISEETIDCHYGKHLDAYVKNLNGLIAETDYGKLSLAEIIVKSAKDPRDQKIFNNAAQVWNHDFFFKCMARDNGSSYPNRLAENFASLEKFKEEFKAAALGVFGSGWVWLVGDSGAYKIIAAPNADTPIARGIKPLLALDVWEHAYYVDYRNRRADFVDAFLDHLVDWAFVVDNMEK